MQNVVQNPATRTSAENAAHAPALFGPGEEAPQPSPRAAEIDFVAIQRSPEFKTLRSRFRRFAFPMTLLFILWYLVYVVLAAYAHDFMSKKVYGEINVAIVLGVLQFVSTALITIAYLRFARRRLDPQIETVRQQAGVQ
ncbi:uncharacterized membrane protein (DUF485 family) [Amycolatopsis bartoniae]|uniref:DUF485 domain-containing protein n=1 Tax=Amycolatopsis bartoniae TaxID=941986 RepID=A0A8H9MF29_9PSEU|nr:DUF485 domain-containing protein [Amycolatopsis bartoniae]MBB2937631.1 uncharacterized membrane protein (DUF485 family) [Amycolatopsis bartoniae]TVT00629.1 DUF485 domain-containing protein [Amycolatopsis bartoniae]GHF82679.1 hypothetical protein GCM10017566_66070 [Amycolatopsis bartoniae]